MSLAGSSVGVVVRVGVPIGTCVGVDATMPVGKGDAVLKAVGVLAIEAVGSRSGSVSGGPLHATTNAIASRSMPSR